MLFNIFKRTPKPGERYLSDNPYNEVPVTVISTQRGYVEFQEPWKAGRTVTTLTSFRICFPKRVKEKLLLKETTQGQSIGEMRTFGVGVGKSIL